MKISSSWQCLSKIVPDTPGMTSDWRKQISYAEEIGLGSGKYEMVTVKQGIY
jgi:hypothetical protein